MLTHRIASVAVMIILFLGACNVPVSPTPSFTPQTPDLSHSIGRISAEETIVESGPLNGLTQITQTENFFSNYAVRVTNGGVANLNLMDDQVSIRLFNDTAIDNVKADPSGTPNNYVRMKLVYGGLSGEVPKNGGMPIQVEIANGVNIYVLGTQFLVLYDPETGTTYFGNFDGTVVYSIPGRSAQFTQAGQLFEISSNFETKQSPLTFTRTDIDNLTSNRRSTLLATFKDFIEPTLTSTPTPTPMLFPTSFPTITPTPTKIIPCNKAEFVTDITIPDGTSFSPGFQFAKVWRLKNVGTCTWTNGYSFFFTGGDQMGGPASANLSSSVAPGQTVDISVGLVAPALPGSYRGDWMLRSPSGASFGAGPNGTTPIWVKINVMGLPDLTVGITSGPVSTCGTGAQCIYATTVGFVITNTSNVDVTNAFQVVVEATGNPYGDLPAKTITVNGLASGVSQNFSESLSGLCYGCTAQVTVDSSNIILESNESNNVSATQQTTVTQRVVDINPGAGSSSPGSLTVYNGQLYFAADGADGAGRELWKFDGTSAGRVADIFPGTIGSNPGFMTVFNNALYFAARGNDGAGIELWKFDGVSIRRVADIFPGTQGSNPAYPAVFNNALYFSAFDEAGNELWKYDGTTVSRAAGLNPGWAWDFSFLTIYNGQLYFQAHDNQADFELWVYDGTTAGRAADINPGGSSGPFGLGVYNGQLYFQANGGDGAGIELWKYDGTTASRAADINPGPGNSSPAFLTVYNGQLYFQANGSDGAGIELWKYDGTTASRAADINPGPGDSSPASLTVYNGQLYFQANGGDGAGTELWSLTAP